VNRKNQQDPIWGAQFRSPDLAQSLGLEVIGQHPGRSARGARGRLDPGVLLMLGRGLKDCFDDAAKQEVPDRIKVLLQRF
jgi:hypothetical protein